VKETVSGWRRRSTRAKRILVVTAWFGAALMTALAGAPRLARAFHAGSQFDQTAGAGGGGGVFYSGAPRERGWDCTACHLDPPRAIRLDVAAAPAALFTTGQYVPNQVYSITAKLIGEHAGLNSPQSNYNGFTVAALDARGAPIGHFANYSPDDLYDGGFVLASAGRKTAATEWTFTWTAPVSGGGAVTFYFTALDGNGAGSAPGVVLTDPWGDDFAAAVFTVVEGASACSDARAPAKWALHESRAARDLDDARRLLGRARSDRARRRLLSEQRGRPLLLRERAQ
jgi:hypothetical protein